MAVLTREVVIASKLTARYLLLCCYWLASASAKNCSHNYLINMELGGDQSPATMEGSRLMPSRVKKS